MDDDSNPLLTLDPLERFFIASSGFVEGDLDKIGNDLFEWRSRLGRSPVKKEVSGDLIALLRTLNPLTDAGAPRELLVPCGSWVAYFRSSTRGSDPSSTCAELADRLRTRALGVSANLEEIRYKGMYLPPGIQFHLWAPDGKPPLLYRRTIDMTQDGGPWFFSQSGEPFEFEELDQYSRRRVKDRFTAAMLQRYCRALGFDPFDLDSYGTRGLLISNTLRIPRGSREVII